MLINAQQFNLSCDMVDRCVVFRSFRRENDLSPVQYVADHQGARGIELPQHSPRQLSTASTAQPLLMSQSHCQHANGNSDEIVKNLRLARQQLDRPCMLKQGLVT